MLEGGGRRARPRMCPMGHGRERKRRCAACDLCPDDVSVRPDNSGTPPGYRAAARRMTLPGSVAWPDTSAPDNFPNLRSGVSLESICLSSRLASLSKEV
ncbi:hypothetical protein CABS01_01124 [Colletotrichum abscissum]|uniref:Uncharacterized protein n=1 Tax=Colletotrichum costaricense TaxID=1209916 RepID=A0AAI9YVV4_9PEZI|nr:uncharacterized protein CCOS01_08515 [Colletotrichum costaricense]XP_060401582.1 uncharacterized protein CABS01_01124 [Colletotrichum abscissum]KAI3531803.1 hypothetical protein CSPX01_13874 [Colletotrichum filicis]KAK1505656.1 hypothetical protein CABS01_01124 [Colletotrichum abscissum]KAK1526097.1 hypothetical protein CCOS01_08515 [Colletotrichum costaricense]